MPMFRKRPVVIEARQLAGATSDVHGVYQWIESHTSGSSDKDSIFSAAYEPAYEARGES